MRSSFVKESFFSAPRSDLFGFHERPDAFRLLTPESSGVEVTGTVSTLEPSDEIASFTTSFGPLKFPFEMAHTAYEKDRMFRDYQPSVQFCDEDWRILFTDDHVLRGGDAPYPTDLPRCGEVVVERRRLREDPTRARYMRVGIYAPAPPRPLPNNLHFDSGTPLFVTTLFFGPSRIGAGEEGQARRAVTAAR